MGFQEYEECPTGTFLSELPASQEYREWPTGQATLSVVLCTKESLGEESTSRGSTTTLSSLFEVLILLIIGGGKGGLTAPAVEGAAGGAAGVSETERTPPAAVPVFAGRILRVWGGGNPTNFVASFGGSGGIMFVAIAGAGGAGRVLSSTESERVAVDITSR